MKIYFGGSIRGGRDDKDLYSQIIQLLKKYGEVVTEHVGDADLTSMGEDKAAEFIFNRDMDWMRESEVAVFEVTQPSLGVGYELAMAETLGKRVLCLYRPSPEKSLSAMVRGNKAFLVEDYQTIDEASKILDSFLG
jgi:nucleoside 2-deoxyribosyltransferase